MDIKTENRSTLKTFFEAGDVPTQQQFASLIDAMVNNVDDGIVKTSGLPLSMQAEIDANASVLDFYHSFSNDKTQAWRIGLKGQDPQAFGFNIMDKTNSSRFYIDASSGNIGIGIDNPQVELDVTGSITATGSIKAQSLSINSGTKGVSINANGYVGIGATPISTSKLYVNGDIETPNNFITSITPNNAGLKIFQNSIFAYPATTPDITTFGDFNIFSHSNSAAGNYYWTCATFSKGKVTLWGDLQVNASGGGGVGNIVVGGNIKGQSLSINSGTSGVTIDTLGKVGIGALPDATSKLYVAGDIKGQSLTLNSGLSGVSVNSTGFVGIGATPSVTSKLYVNGEIETNNYLSTSITPNNAGIKIYQNNLYAYPASSAADTSTFGEFNILSHSHSAGGNYIWYCANFAKGKVTLWGDLWVNASGGGGAGNITYGGLLKQSDLRLKDNILSLESSLEKILEIRGVFYNWKDKERNGGKREIGFIAQEVEKHYPELVHEDEEGFKKVDYVSFTAILLQAVKELNSKVEALQEKNIQSAN